MCYQHKVSVIPIGLDRQTYLNPEPNLVNYYRALFGERFFLFVGAFRYYKGLKYLIDAAILAPYPIVIVGSGPIEGQLKAIVQKHGLNNVFFLGQVSERNKCALLEACYSVIFPSHLRSEAFGVVLLEGVMFSKPLISCEIGTGTTYINIDQLTGLVVPPSDPVTLSNAMIWLWNHPDQAEEMGKKAYVRYIELFTAKQMAQSYYNLYQNLLNR
jgi:O-antigen biosynthesis rhamnosyltransferase